jgi:hypothetical protein
MGCVFALAQAVLNEHLYKVYLSSFFSDGRKGLFCMGRGGEGNRYLKVAGKHTPSRTIDLLLLAKSERRTNVLASQLDAKSTLELAENLLVGDSFTGLIFGHDLGLLIALLSKVLLGHTLFLASTLDDTADGHVHLGRGCHIIVTVQFGNTLVVTVGMASVRHTLALGNNSSTRTSGSIDLALAASDLGSVIVTLADDSNGIPVRHDF